MNRKKLTQKKLKYLFFYDQTKPCFICRETNNHIPVNSKTSIIIGNITYKTTDLVNIYVGRESKTNIHVTGVCYIKKYKRFRAYYGKKHLGSFHLYDNAVFARHDYEKEIGICDSSAYKYLKNKGLI